MNRRGFGTAISAMCFPWLPQRRETVHERLIVRHDNVHGYLVDGWQVTEQHDIPGWFVVEREA